MSNERRTLHAPKPRRIGTYSCQIQLHLAASTLDLWYISRNQEHEDGATATATAQQSVCVVSTPAAAGTWPLQLTDSTDPALWQGNQQTDAAAAAAALLMWSPYLQCLLLPLIDSPGPRVQPQQCRVTRGVIMRHVSWQGDQHLVPQSQHAAPRRYTQRCSTQPLSVVPNGQLQTTVMVHSSVRHCHWQQLLLACTPC